jgi:hypothetical protein
MALGTAAHVVSGTTIALDAILFDRDGHIAGRAGS